VVTENYADAGNLMLKIGKDRELIKELAYHDWPLFREFRDTKEFVDAYLAVYGYKYSSKLSSLAEEKKAEVEEANLEDLI
jgi:hypothetical protein